MIAARACLLLSQNYILQESQLSSMTTFFSLRTQYKSGVWCTSINIIFTQTHHSHHFTSCLQLLLTFVKIAMVMEFNQVFLLQLLIVQVQFIHTVYLPSFEFSELDI